MTDILDTCDCSRQSTIHSHCLHLLRILSFPWHCSSTCSVLCSQPASPAMFACFDSIFCLILAFVSFEGFFFLVVDLQLKQKDESLTSEHFRPKRKRRRHAEKAEKCKEEKEGRESKEVQQEQSEANFEDQYIIIAVNDWKTNSRRH
eukprot:g21186.t1